MKTALRKPLLNFHLWTGLTVGLIFIVVALSGAALIFRSKLERTLDPRRFIVTPGATRMSLDSLVARAREAHPSATFLSVRIWADATMPFTALFTDKQYVHLNPYTGEFLGARQRYGEGFGWIEGLHKYLRLDPGIGENVNGALAIVFVLLLASGVVLWWPATRRALRAGITFNWRLKGRPRNLSLHKTIGFYISLVLLFSALTGIPIAFESTRIVLDALTFSTRELPVKAPAAPAAVFAGFDRVDREIQQLMPGARETYMPLPKAGLVAAYAIAAEAVNANARSYVYLDATGKVIRYAPYASAPAGYRLYYWLLSLHTAMTGGYVVQLLLLCGTLGVPFLAWTGLRSYLARQASHRARAAESRPTIATTQLRPADNAQSNPLAVK